MLAAYRRGAEGDLDQGQFGEWFIQVFRHSSPAHTGSSRNSLLDPVFLAAVDRYGRREHGFD
jgi:hypothetical protein